jgi:FemAB-related protein (PEP-CTERM system-associated)
MQMVAVSLVPDNGFEGWERFIAAANGGPMHLAAWHRVLRDAFAVTPLFLQARRDDGTVAGVLPLYLSRSVFTGRHLASLDGGIFAVDANSTAALLTEAKSLRRRTEGRYLLLRDAPKEESLDAIRTTMIRRVINTSLGVDAIWRSLKSDTRKEVRRGERAGYQIKRVHDEPPLRKFYQIFARRMHQLGTPVVPLRYFTAMVEHLGEALSIFIIEKEGEVCGGLVCVAANTRASAIYAAVERQHMHAYANYFMFWRVIEHFAATGLPSLDFGTNAPGSSVGDFKSSWPVDAESVAYDYYADNAKATQTNARTVGEKSVAQRVWSRLPQSVANTVGPIIRAQLPFG